VLRVIETRSRRQQRRESPGRTGIRTTVGRVDTADDVATVAAFLLGPDAVFITGADLPMVGGVRWTAA
jgi:NAD(P)-dependent dehydrogenase (short-subunit alcohol dehydrogenase family)